MKKSTQVYGLIGWVTVSQLAGIVGALYTSSAIEQWYVFLEKPALNPPNWIFGPVWTVLYICMGVAAFLVWKTAGRSAEGKRALYIFVTQLVLNTVWSILFFGLQSPEIALIEIVLLWTAIVVTIIKMFPLSRWSAYLLVPYLLWVSFATYLNASIWWLN